MTRKEGQTGIINIRMWHGGDVSGGREEQSGEGDVLNY